MSPEPQWPWFWAALVLTVVDLTVLALGFAHDRRRAHVRAAPTDDDTLELGNESPALVNFLTHGFVSEVDIVRACP